MDSVSNKKARVVKKDVKGKGRGKHPSVKIKAGGTLKKSADCQKGTTCRNVKKVAQEKIDKSIYEPVHEQFSMLVEYINILDTKKGSNSTEELYALMKLIEMVYSQSIKYLNYYLQSSLNYGARW